MRSCALLLLLGAEAWTNTPRRGSRRAPRTSRSAAAQDDVVVIGAGVGGLCAGALLATYGYKVRVVEAHDRAGGCAHGFTRRVKGIEGDFHFDSGPSLFSGCSSPSNNPLRQVLDAVGEAPTWATYSEWTMSLPQGQTMKVKSGNSKAFSDELGRLDGPSAESDWKNLVSANFALGEVVAGVPPIALRADAGAVVTARPYLGGLDPSTMLKFGIETVTKKISPSGPFSAVLDAAKVGRGSLVYRWFDFLAFALSGLPVKATSAAACSFMMKEFFAPGAVLDYPIGGSQAIADALVRAIEKRGGTVELKKKVQGLVFDDRARCVGVELQDGTQRTAAVAVISNADAWATSRLVEKSLPQQAKKSPKLQGSNLDSSTTPATRSFVHLHVAFKADAALDADLGMHHIVVNDWDQPIDASDNCVFVSVSSVLDKAAAPEGYHVLHAYLPATEPWSLWKDLDPKSEAYAEMKAERAEPLWRALERFIPNVRERAVFSQVGSPLTHARYLRRHEGTFGPAWRAGEAAFPGHKSPVEGLWCVGDSTFPGIGVPAVAGSGIAVANSIAPLGKHLELLDNMRKDGSLPR
mmetsp:Transcript_32666/g.112448  ORF Transcript_32666/g.112448 Transcript_32666/m.112448 type:complete len:580 (+) Transcript_32666:135-1874(+)